MLWWYSEVNLFYKWLHSYRKNLFDLSKVVWLLALGIGLITVVSWIFSACRKYYLGSYRTFHEDLLLTNFPCLPLKSSERRLLNTEICSYLVKLSENIVKIWWKIRDINRIHGFMISLQQASPGFINATDQVKNDQNWRKKTKHF